MGWPENWGHNVHLLCPPLKKLQKVKLYAMEDHLAKENASSVADNTRERNTRSVKSFFELMHQRKLSEWNNLWDENGYIYIPYPVEGFPDIIKTRKTIAEGFEKLFTAFKSFDYQITAIYPSLDPDIIVVEYTNHVILLKNDIIYNGTNIAVFKFANGKIFAYHDYFNPIKFKTVIDNLE
jgi:ketosteroid isomerase-like protein